MTLKLLLLKLKGSSTSGNWGHEGRPGKHGGSVSGGGRGKVRTVNNRKGKKEQPRKEKRNFEDIKHPSGSELSKLHNAEACKKAKCRDAVDVYNSFYYVSINGYLRDGASPSFSKEPNNEFEKRQVKEIDRVLDELPRTNKDMRVTRRIESKDFAESLAEGTVFQDKAYVSTTIKPGGLPDYGKYKIDIIVPKGSKGAYLGNLGGWKKEDEFTLPRNAKFKIIKNDVPKGGNSITMEYLGDN